VNFIMVINGVRWKFETETYLWQFAWREIDGVLTPVLEECNGNLAVGKLLRAASTAKLKEGA
jgi:hypothetical protein